LRAASTPGVGRLGPRREPVFRATPVGVSLADQGHFLSPFEVLSEKCHRAGNTGQSLPTNPFGLSSYRMGFRIRPTHVSLRVTDTGSRSWTTGSKHQRADPAPIH
jgi:hypothetical protein